MEKTWIFIYALGEKTALQVRSHGVLLLGQQ